MKLIFAILLMACFAQAKELSQDELALLYVQEQQHTLQIAEAANERILTTAVQCFERHRCLRDSPGEQCPSVKPFEKVERLLGGGEIKLELDCEKLFLDYFGVELGAKPRLTPQKEKAFNEARLNLALSAPARREGNPQLAINPNNSLMILDPSPSSVVPRWSSGFGVDYKNPMALSDQEIKRSQSFYGSWLEEWLSEFWELQQAQLTDLQFEKFEGSYGELTRAYFEQTTGECNLQKILLFQLEVSQCQDLENRLRTTVIFQQFANFVYENRLPQFRESRLLEYLKTNLENPLFFQISSPEMTDQELWHALRSMKAASEKSRRSGAVKSDDWREYLSNPNLLDLGLFESIHFQNEYELTSIEYSEIVDQIQSEYQSQLRRASFKDGALLAGALALCFIPSPVKRALTLSLRALFNSACFTSLGLPINTYLLMSGIKAKAKSWNSALSAATSEIQLEDLKSLSKEDTELFINAAFMPLILRIDGKMIRSLSNAQLLRRALRETRSKGKIR